MIVGISGSFSSGKDTLAAHLVKKYGFKVVSTGDIVREVALSDRGSIERPVLQQVATELRQKYGGGVLVERAIKSYEQSGGGDNLVITGIRSLGEAKSIKQLGGKLLFIDAPMERRYKWMKGRARDDEAKISLEEFKKSEAAELAAGDSDADFNILAIKDLADTVIINDKTPKEFFATSIKSLSL